MTTRPFSCILLVFCFFCLRVDICGQATRKVILENIVGSWCGLCPEGGLSFQKMLSKYPEVVGVMAHVDDPMATPISSELADVYSGGGVNLFLVDRYLFEGQDFIQLTWDTLDLKQVIEQRLAMQSPVSVSLKHVSFDEDLRTLDVEVHADFLQAVLYDDLRFNLLLVEDSVVSTQQGYQQVNYFNSYDGHFYEGAGNPIFGYVHRKVLRYSAGGNWGTPESLVPINGNFYNANDSYVYNYSITIPEDWDLSNLWLVGLVQRYDEVLSGRYLVNAEDVHFDFAVANGDSVNVGVDAFNVNGNLELEVMPNRLQLGQAPVTFSFNLPKQQNTHIWISDLQGRNLVNLRQEVLNAGLHSIHWNTNQFDFTEGMYLVHIKQGSNLVTRKFILAR